MPPYNCSRNDPDTMTARTAITLSALLMFAAVALGAFGAHALKSRLTPEATEIWHTAVLYHGWHALGLGLLGLLLIHRPDNVWLGMAGWCFLLGIALFSGSLYALALTQNKTLGAITPVGGIALLVGWLAFACGAWL
jgi:uncharacterized membrane protein YgdD (TMEM256/DUF423 family)